MEFEDLHIILDACLNRLTTEKERKKPNWLSNRSLRHHIFEKSDIKKCESITPEDIAIMSQAEYEDYQQLIKDYFNWKALELIYRNLDYEDIRDRSDKKVQELAKEVYLFTQSLDEYLSKNNIN